MKAGWLTYAKGKAEEQLVQAGQPVTRQAVNALLRTWKAEARKRNAEIDAEFRAAQENARSGGYTYNGS